jgi:hypothetical protein
MWTKGETAWIQREIRKLGLWWNYQYSIEK